MSVRYRQHADDDTIRMSSTSEGASVGVPEINLTDPDLLKDPFTNYGRMREQTPIAQIPMPGIGAVWAVLRHPPARAVLSDPRFAITNGSFIQPPGIPEHCLQYMRTMSEQDGPEHARLRRLATPAFTARRAAPPPPPPEGRAHRAPDPPATR